MTTQDQTDALAPPAVCKLCGQAAISRTIGESDDHFCCVGCRAVYQILSQRSELNDFQNHPLFLQAARTGLISNPHLLEEIRSKRLDLSEGELEKLHLEIHNLWCPSCAEVIRFVLLREKGVANCAVDYSTDLASIEYSPKILSKERILGLIQKLGYSPSLFNDGQAKAHSFGLYLRLVIAVFFSLNIMMFSYPIYASYFTTDAFGHSHLFAWGSLFASLPVLFYSASPIYRRFFTGIAYGFIGMEALIAIGVSSAFGLSVFELVRGGTHVYFDSMTVIITFVLLGKIIESKAKFSTKETLQRLVKAIPKRGRKKMADGSESFALVKEIEKGDKLVVLPGEKIVLDGMVTDGEGNVDESVMTGEAVPVRKMPGDRVMTGTVLSQGRLVYQAETTEQETALFHIIETIEKDIGQKSEYSRAVDPIVRCFIPAVLMIAFAAGIFLWMNGNPPQDIILRAVSILLISCPCAIGIAAPIAESGILSAMANLGAIVRSRGCLRSFGQEDLFVFDKTGTVTEGSFRVVSGLEKLSLEELLILKSITARSLHPVSVSIFKQISLKPKEEIEIEEIQGMGLKARYEGITFCLGSKHLMAREGIELPIVPAADIHEEEILTTVYFSSQTHLLAKLSLGDKVRRDAPETIQSLSGTSTFLLSGDSESAVKAVAEYCHFDGWKAEASPLEKRDLIDRFRKEGKNVAMMGDGINDAAALAGANTGISVVSATDLSIQVSDIMLTTDRLTVIPKIRNIARKGQKIIKQNLFWAFFYNIIGIGLAAGGMLTPLLSTIAMMLSSLIVLINAQRVKE